MGLERGFSMTVLGRMPIGFINRENLVFPSLEGDCNSNFGFGTLTLPFVSAH